VEEDPDAAVEDEAGLLPTGVEGGDEAEEEDDGQDEDAERDGAVAPIDDEEGGGEEEGKKDLELVGVYWEAVVGGVEHLGQRDEVEEECGGGGGDGDVTPAGTVVERCREDGERGYAVEEDRDSEPEERHNYLCGWDGLAANLKYSVVRGGGKTLHVGLRDGYPPPPSKVRKVFERDTLDLDLEIGGEGLRGACFCFKG
jgi:hypothetical protein